MGRSEHRTSRVYAAGLSLGVTVSALSSAPLVAQVSPGAQSASCLEGRLTPFGPLGQTSDNNLVASVRPALTSFFIKIETHTLTGRLTCADSRPAAFYNCGHTKQNVLGCKPDCFVEPYGSQYVPEGLGRSYSVTGDPNQIWPFLTDGHRNRQVEGRHQSKPCLSLRRRKKCGSVAQDRGRARHRASRPGLRSLAFRQ
jgi:hypothetical protein